MSKRLPRIRGGGAMRCEFHCLLAYVGWGGGGSGLQVNFISYRARLSQGLFYVGQITE